MRAIIWRKEKKELDIALGDYNEAIRLDPTSASVYNNRGLAWHDKKEYDKAIADYNEAIRLDPEIRPRLQQPRRHLARQEGIRQGHRRLQRGHPARSQIRRRLSATAATPGGIKKEYDKAVADYNEAIRLDPQFAEAYRTAPGSGRPAPMRNTVTARKPSSQRRRRVSCRSGRNRITSTSSPRPMPRWAISTRPSSGNPRRSSF